VNAERDLEFPGTRWTERLVEEALAEDVGTGDASTEVGIPASLRARGTLVARTAGVIAGLPLVRMLYTRLDPALELAAEVKDGTAVHPGQRIAVLEGAAAAMLTGERAALNFLQHLSGIATLTARYVAEVAGTPCRVLDTRKTLPGYRSLAKYAVRAGGGRNHRHGLYDMIMFKDNHWVAAAGRMDEVIAAARAAHPDLAVEVEVDNLSQLKMVLPLGVEWVLLDNFTPDGVRYAVRYRDANDPAHRTRLEASGNISLDNVREYAEAGVDAVSVGRLTHSAPALDVSLDIELGSFVPGGSAA
jgi:nicotinate-nucleotide pyrophosphorylase (carboxylating)